MQEPWEVQLLVPISQLCFEEKHVGTAPLRTLVAMKGEVDSIVLDGFVEAGLDSERISSRWAFAVRLERVKP